MNRMSQGLVSISSPSPTSAEGAPGTAEAASSGRATPPKSMVERVTAIVDCFPDGRTTLLLEEVSQRTGLPRSTTHRILEQLIAQDWVEHTGEGYRLGTRASGGSASGGGAATQQLRRAAGPVLQDLLLRTGMVVHLSLLDRASIVYLDKLGGRLAVDVPSQVGNSAPVHATAGGKAILSQLDDRVVRDLLPTPLARLTDRTIATLPTLLMELRQVRQRHGLAFESGEAVEGIACVAAPVRFQGGEMAAVSLCSRAHNAQLQRFAPLVVRAARTIETALLWPEDHARDAALAPPERRAPDAPGPWSPETSQRLLALARQRAWL